MIAIDIAGAAVHYWTGKVETPTDGRGIVALHGAGGNGLGWFRQKHPLGDRRFFCAVDLPGHGRSKGRPAASIEAYADVVQALIDHLHITQVTLLGHSMGGAIALTLALRLGERLHRLILMNTGATLPVAEETIAALQGDPERAREYLAGLAFSTRATQRLVRLVLDQMDLDAALTDFLACRAVDLKDRVAAIGAPTLIIAGSHDQLTPPPLSDHLARAIRGAEYHVVQGAGHLPMIERPDVVNAILADFLERTE